LTYDHRIDIAEYFFKQKRDKMCAYVGKSNPRRNWKADFMRSLTYELTTIYAD